MSTPVNKGEGGVQNTQNPVNVVYEQPRSCDDDREEQFLAAKKMKWALTVAFVISKAMRIEKLQIPI